MEETAHRCSNERSASWGKTQSSMTDDDDSLEGPGVLERFREVVGCVEKASDDN